jgi:hypothetical protein
MAMSKREKVLVSIVLVLGVFCLYFLTFLNPKLSELRTLNTDIDNKSIDASNVQMQEQIIAGMEKAITANEDKIAALNAGITSGFDQPAVLVYLEQTVNAHATKTGFVFPEFKQVGQFDVCFATISMTSNYDGIKALLAEFGESPYFIKVVSLSAELDTERIAQITAAQEANAAAGNTVVPVPSADELVNVKMGIQIYAQPGAIGETAYDFADGYQYGGDIFN